MDTRVDGKRLFFLLLSLKEFYPRSAALSRHLNLVCVRGVVFELFQSWALVGIEAHSKV